MKTEDIQIRDPFILPVPEEGLYYLFGTTSKRPFAIEPDAWDGFDGYRSRDLQEWEGPFPAFRPAPGFWATTQFWAPEVHRYQGRYQRRTGNREHLVAELLKAERVARGVREQHAAE